MKGSEFYRLIESLQGQAREDMILAHWRDVPSWIADQTWASFTIEGKLTIFVTRDVYSIGEDSDFFRVPMAAPTAQKIADAWNSILPSRKLSKLIWDMATVRLDPKPFPPDAKMETSTRFLESNTTIEKQLAQKGVSVAANLVAGHKKDLVVGPELDGSRVAIYGWHQANGVAIQPYSTAHGAYYADYSHGVRLVFRIALYEGKPVDLMDLFQDPSLAWLVSDQGSFTPHFPNAGRVAVAPPATAKPPNPTSPYVPVAMLGNAAEEVDKKSNFFNLLSIASFTITLIGFFHASVERDKKPG